MIQTKNLKVIMSESNCQASPCGCWKTECSSDPGSGKFLNYFTRLPTLFHVLKNKSISMRSPLKWDDQNDVAYMKHFQEWEDVDVAALCFLGDRETIYHWTAFASGLDGVCLEFNREKLQRAAEDQGMELREVEYHAYKCGKVQPNMLSGDHKILPFLKRHPYRSEIEVRLIKKMQPRSINPEKVAFECELPSGSLQKVTFSPWLYPAGHTAIVAAVRALIEASGHFPELLVVDEGNDPNAKLNLSQIREHTEWINNLPPPPPRT